MCDRHIKQSLEEAVSLLNDQKNTHTSRTCMSVILNYRIDAVSAIRKCCQSRFTVLYPWKRKQLEEQEQLNLLRLHIR